MLHQFIKERNRFKCVICDYSFSTKQKINMHVASVHEEKKPFKCNICEFRCSRKGHLNSHFTSVHKGKKLELVSNLVTLKETVQM